MTIADNTDRSRAPLAGRSVVVTRSREQAADLVGRLEALGAEVLVWPVIDLVDPEDWTPADRAIDALSTYDWVAFTSTNAVDRFFSRLETHGVDARALSGISIAAVGTSTAARLEAHGIQADYVPSKFVAEGVLEGFLERGVGAGSRVLIPRALKAREVLPEALREHGATVDVVPVYRNVLGAVDTRIAERIADGDVDAVTFTSSSTVRNLLTLLDEAAGPKGRAGLGRAAMASIGSVTSDTLRENGLTVDVEASPFTVAGLVDALSARFGN